MADSGITKKALAMAISELMEEESVSQITIGEICEKCEMNRKSFYYHFKDKYDLIIWMYNTEFETYSKHKEYVDVWDFLTDICCVLNKKRKFYRKAFESRGENSLKNYIGKELTPVICKTLVKRAEILENTEAYIEFIRDAAVTAIEKWLNKKETLSAEKFIEFLKKCFYEAGRI